jgi:16S rRNA (uracil1498-N3)-methyltransferase
MKQSLKSTITKLNDPCSFKDFVGMHTGGTRLIAHCSGITERSRIGDVYAKGKDCLLIIGPEGDFSADEITTATGLGYKPVHLGKSRLRTETAGIAACWSIYYLNQ